MSKNELEWGQTPFDECTREELIQHCARLYSATSALSSAAQMVQDKSLFWTRGLGSNGTESALKPYQRRSEPSSQASASIKQLRMSASWLISVSKSCTVLSSSSSLRYGMASS